MSELPLYHWRNKQCSSSVEATKSPRAIVDQTNTPYALLAQESPTQCPVNQKKREMPFSQLAPCVRILFFVY